MGQATKHLLIIINYLIYESNKGYFKIINISLSISHRSILSKFYLNYFFHSILRLSINNRGFIFC